MELIKKYFPYITEQQTSMFAALFDLYREWNEKINVISRKDIDHIYLHHILHSLSIAKFTRFTPDTEIIDVGTGGGFPAIPLAIMFPECRFTLLDSIAKKIRVASEVSKAIGLDNCIFENRRMEEVKGKYDFVISRAALRLNDLVRVSQKNIAKHQRNALPNGIIALKGGDLAEETKEFPHTQIQDISEYFQEDFFETKKIIYLPITN